MIRGLLKVTCASTALLGLGVMISAFLPWSWRHGQWLNALAQPTLVRNGALSGSGAGLLLVLLAVRLFATVTKRELPNGLWILLAVAFTGAAFCLYCDTLFLVGAVFPGTVTGSGSVVSYVGSFLVMGDCIVLATLLAIGVAQKQLARPH